MSAPLFTAAQFANAYDTPLGQSGAPAHAGDPVCLTVSDGTVQTVFDSLSTALKCLAQMRAQGQWFVQASDEVIVVSVGTKLLLMESSLTNQKLLQQCTPLYTSSGQTVFQNKLASAQSSLTGALQKSGYLMQAALPFVGNYDLAAAPGPPAVQIVDWFYQASPTSSTQGSQLTDATPIAFSTLVPLS